METFFRVTGVTGPGDFPTQRPVTWGFDVFFDLRLNKRLSKQPWGWWFETPSWSLWRQCNLIRPESGFVKPWNHPAKWIHSIQNGGQVSVETSDTWFYQSPIGGFIVKEKENIDNVAIFIKIRYETIDKVQQLKESRSKFRTGLH